MSFCKQEKKRKNIEVHLMNLDIVHVVQGIHHGLREKGAGGFAGCLLSPSVKWFHALLCVLLVSQEDSNSRRSPPVMFFFSWLP